MKKYNKKIFVIFVILLLISMTPTAFTESPDPILFGWLPAPLFFWWILMVINLVFVLWVSKVFVNSAEDEEEDKE